MNSTKAATLSAIAPLAIALLFASATSCGNDTPATTDGSETIGGTPTDNDTDLCPALGDTRCEGNLVLTCADYDSNGFMEWGAAAPCGAQLCVAGACAAACTDSCAALGARQCEAESVQLCGDYDGNGCLEWGAGSACQGGAVCLNGFCSIGGQDECTVQGARRCDATTGGVQACSDFDFNGSLEWGDATPCQAGQVCSNGHCASQCADECTVIGARQCAGGGGFQVCGDADGNGCLDWSADTACGAGEVCSNGNCATTCSNECTVDGATRCAIDAVEACGDFDGNGCLEWGDAVSCGGLSCSDGTCTQGCVDECTAIGAKDCELDSVKTCGDWDSDPCLDWGTPLACASSQSCSNGSCALSCTAECSVVGERQCGGPASWQDCGDFNTDGCLEWGTAVTCGAGEICSDGNCAISCTSECTTAGSRQCDGASSWQECDDFDGDGCLEWSSAAACGGDLICLGGNCAVACTDSCNAVGERQCNGTDEAFQVCGDWNLDGCLEWGAEVACSDGPTCDAGFCATSCSDDCSDGTTQCAAAGEAVETCSDSDFDGCSDWGAPAVACGAGEICTAGSCGGVPPPGVVKINEILVDSPDGSAFVELWGEAGLSLAGFTLVGVNGANGLDYQSIDLTGAIGGDELFVLAAPGSDAAILAAADVTTADADYQNGPDSIQLRWGNQVVDAVGYGDFTGATFAGEGTPSAAAPSGSSLGRDGLHTDTTDNLADFTAAVVITPGTDNGVGNIAPSADITCPANGKTGDQLAFSAAGSMDSDGSIVSYSFDFGDFVVLSGPGSAVSHEFSSVGLFTVEVTVTDDDGSTDVASCLVNIADANAPTVVFIQPLENLQITQGDTVQFKVDAVPSPGRSIATTELLIDGIVTGPDDNLVPYEFTYTILPGALTGSTILAQVRATDDMGTAGLSDPVELFVWNDPPVAAFTAVITGNLEVTVNAAGVSDTETDSADLEVRWDWDNDGSWDIDWSTTKTQVYTYALDGAHTIAMEVRDDVGQVHATTREVNFQSVLDVGGTVNSTLWYGTINITGDVVVPAGETLTIDEGTTVVFVEVDQDSNNVGDFDLTIDGTLIVQGTAGNPVIFTTLPSAGAGDASSWNTLTLGSGSTGNVIDHAVFEYGDVALNVLSDATISNVEFRDNKTCMNIAAGGDAVSLDNINCHDSVSDGITFTTGTVTANNLTVTDNGGRGIWMNNTGSFSVTTCDISNNGSHGLEVSRATANLDECQITYNGATGIFYRRDADGLLTHSELKYNNHEGIRAIMGSNQNPSPVIEYNNIFSNAAGGSMTVVNISVTAASNFGSTADVTSPTWTAPNSAPILLTYATYSENPNHSVLEGRIQRGNGSTVYTIGTNNAGSWYDMSATPDASMKAFVMDDHGAGNATTTLSKAAYVDPAASWQVSTLLSAGMVSARHNYFGAWPDVLSVVSYEAAATLDIEGFVGAAYDTATWDKTNHRGGYTITTPEVWDSDVWMTGVVTVGAGGSLTVDPGVTITYVPTDQDGNGTGDWTIWQAAGAVVMNGSPVAPITIDVLGAVPVNGGFTAGVEANGAGTTDLTEVDIADGKNGIWANAGTVTLAGVDVTDSTSNGIEIIGSATVTAATVTSILSGYSGVWVSSSGAVSFDGLTSTDNALWGVEVGEANNGGNLLTNGDFQRNVAGGVSLRSSSFDITFSNLRLNDGYGLRLWGAGTGTIDKNVIYYNGREGVLAQLKGTAHPSHALHDNNIAFNADLVASPAAERIIIAPMSAAVTSNFGSTADVSSSYWTSPGEAILAVFASYSENPSHSVLTGYIQRSGGTNVHTLGSNQSGWFDMSATATSQVRGHVVDDHGAGNATVNINQACYSDNDGSGPPFVQMTALFRSTTLDATGNYWGGSTPSTQVQETIIGSVDYANFKLSPVPDAGPQ